MAKYIITQTMRYNSLARYMLSSAHVRPSVRLSVRLSICPSQAGTVPKRLNVVTRKQRL